MYKTFGEHWNFHESYFEHPCVVSTDKDVLYTDIRGQGWIYSLRRWWHNLFLLSVSDSRCRDFYSSSYALHLDRARHFRRFSNRIHPFSKFSNNWTVFIIFISIANRLTFHQNTSVVFGQMKKYLLILGMIFEFILLIDVYVILKTGYVDQDKRKVVLSAWKCRMHYCSTKLFLLVASALPLHWILMMRYYGQELTLFCTANRFVCCVKVISVFGLFRVYDALHNWNTDKKSFKMTYFFKLLRIFVLAWVSLLQYLNLLDALTIWYAIYEQKIDPESQLHHGLLARLEEERAFYLLILEFSFICKYLFSFGEIRKFRVYSLDTVTGMMGYLVANLFKLWAFVEWYTILSRQKSMSDTRQFHKIMTLDLLRTKQVTEETSTRVAAYFDYVESNAKITETSNDLYQVLPSTILKEVKLNCYYGFMRRIPYFSDWPIELIEDLTILLKVEIYLVGDVVAHKWIQGDGLIILCSGVLAVYSAHEREIGHMINGDFFGELSLVTDREVRTSSVLAVTNCKVLLLAKGKFRRYMRKYEDRFFKLREKLKERYNRAFDNSFLDPNQYEGLRKNSQEPELEGVETIADAKSS